MQSTNAALLIFPMLLLLTKSDDFVILDSRNTGASWTMFQTDKDESTWTYDPVSNAFMVNSTLTATAQDNWLVSPFIAVEGLSSIHVRIELLFKWCNYSDSKYTLDNCKLDIELFQLPSSTPLGNLINRTNDFIKIDSIKPDKYDVSSEIFIEDIPLTTGLPGLYVAFIDKGTEMSITGIAVTTKEFCPEVVTNLVHFPRSLASQNVTGSCVPNARSSETFQRECKTSGHWVVWLSGSCDCLPGYFECNDTCIHLDCQGQTCTNIDACGKLPSFSCQCTMEKCTCQDLDLLKQNADFTMLNYPATEFAFKTNDVYYYGYIEIPLDLQPLQPDLDDIVAVTCSAVETYERESTQIHFETVNVPPGTESVMVKGWITQYNANSTPRVACFVKYAIANQDDYMGPRVFVIDSEIRYRMFTLVAAKAPVIQLCGDLITVPQYSDMDTYIVQVKLSEAVENSSVTVTCAIVDEQDNGLKLSFHPAVAELGAVLLDIYYSLISIGNPVLVQCFGNSNYGTQYVNNTSAGESVMFVLDTGSVHLTPVQSPVYTTKIELLLLLDAALPEGELIFQCCVDSDIAAIQALSGLSACQCLADYRGLDASMFVTSLADEAVINNASATLTTTNVIANTTNTLHLVNETTDVNETAPSNETTSNLTTNGTASIPLVSNNDDADKQTFTAETNISTDNGVWQLVEDKFLFQTDEVYKKIQVVRNKYTQKPRIEYVSVSCCVPPVINNVEKYINMTVNSTVAADISPTWQFSWNNTTVEEDLETETEFPEPEFVEISPCTCDVYTAHCDTNCCCDKDCSEDALHVFHCLPDLFGGQVADPYTYNCSARSLYSPDWFSLMCVQVSNTAYLGEYFSVVEGLRSTASYAQFVNNRKPDFGFQETSERNFEGNGQTEETAGYIHGTTLKTRVEINGKIQTGYLALPTRSINGQCTMESPLRYLFDFSDTCVNTISSQLCSEESILNARIYVLPSAVTKTMCPLPPLLLKEHNGVEVTDIVVDYLCLNNSNRKTENFSLASLLNFNTVLPNGFADDLIDCQYVYSRNITLPPLPTFNSSINICSNVVLDVKYTFFWTGTMISKLHALIILGNISAFDTVSTKPIPTQIIQSFSAAYRHIGRNTSLENDEPKHRSGMPGYDIGKPIFSGVLQNNSQTNDQYIDTSKAFAIIKAHNDGLCHNSTTEEILFGWNIHTGCLVKLSLEDLSDCDNLNKQVKQFLDNLIPSSHISRGGSPNRNVLAEWISIIRDTRESTNKTENVTNFHKSDTSATYSFLQQKITDSKGIEPREPRLFRVLPQPICENITSGVMIDILYTKAGQSNGHSIYEINGAKLKYMYSNWYLSCSGADAIRCQGNITAVESFVISSEVTFTEVPPKPLPVQKRYWAKKLPANLCKYDTCRQEILYPLTSAYLGQKLSYGLEFTLIGVLFLCGLFIVTKPWW